jgi:signal transduction histidine kinase
MRRSVAPLYGIAAEKAQSLKLHDGVQAFVDCDAAKMERVIVNIVQNALKYTPEGGRIEVSMRRCDGDPPLVAIDVVDTGVGIPGELGIPFTLVTRLLNMQR